MAKQPQWQPKIDPAGGGPMMVTPTNASAPGRALAGAGREVRRLGEIFAYRAERKDALAQAEQDRARRETEALTRATKVADYKLDATRGFIDLRNRVLETADPDAARRLWDAEKETLAPVDDDAVGDDVTMLRRQVYDAAMQDWEGLVDQDVNSLRLRHAQQSAAAAEAVALELGDVELYRERMAAAGPILGLDAQTVQDRIDLLSRQIEKRDRGNEIRAELMAGPADEGLRRLESMNKPRILTDEEWGQLRKEIASDLQIEAAVANQEVERRKAQVAANEARLWADFLDGKVDVTAIPDAIRRGDISAAVGERIVAAATKPMAVEDDPETYARLQALLDDVVGGRADPQAAIDFALSNRDKLSLATQKSALAQAANRSTPQVQALRDAVQRAYGQLVRISEDSLAELLRSGVSGDQMKTAADERAQQLNLVNIVSDELEEWIRKNPDATRAEILRRGREVQVLIAGQAVEEQDRLIGAWQRGESIGFAGGARKREGTSLTPLTPLTQPAAPVAASPAGLEGVWESLTVDEKASALRLLARGVTAAEIAAALQGGR